MSDIWLGRIVFIILVCWVATIAWTLFGRNDPSNQWRNNPSETVWKYHHIENSPKKYPVISELHYSKDGTVKIWYDGVVSPSIDKYCAKPNVVCTRELGCVNG